MLLYISMIEIIKRALNLAWEFVEASTFALGIFVVVYLFFFQVGVVNGTSSYPTIADGERFVTDKISYRFYSPAKGDFVVINSPKNNNIDLIKRIVGLPGETIMISDGSIFLNGKLLTEDYLQPGIKTFSESFLSEKMPYEIPINNYFVLGDNRSHSSDSRDFGPIPRELIVGKAVLVVWPIEHFGQL